MSDVTRIFSAIERGDPRAAEQLLPLVYDELRRLAAQKLAREAPGQTLQATALVHDAYLRLVGDADPGWDSRGHFFAAAAEAMRRILVDNARRKAAGVHGGGQQRVALSEGDWLSRATPDEVVAIDDSLSRLAEDDPASAEVVKLRLFAGMSIEEAARCLGISRASAYRHWAYARARLLAGSAEPSNRGSNRQTGGQTLFFVFRLRGTGGQTLFFVFRLRGTGEPGVRLYFSFFDSWPEADGSQPPSESAAGWEP